MGAHVRLLRCAVSTNRPRPGAHEFDESDTVTGPVDSFLGAVFLFARRSVVSLSV